jgi:hypothetical protein
VPNPVILVNSATGSDAAASGAGPVPALSGTANAATDGAGTTVTLPAGTDLSNVLTDGSHVIFLSDATAGARNFGKITAKAGSGGATPTVVVANAFGLSLTGKDWAIGGKRASIGGTTSKKLVENNSASGDLMPGWAVELESGHTETLAAGWTCRRSGDTVDGPITIRGTFAAGTLPLLNHSANAVFVGFVNNLSYWQFRDFEIRNTNATKTASVAFSITGGACTAVIAERVKVADQTNKFWRAFAFGNFATNFFVLRCELGYLADAAIVAAASTVRTTVRASRIHHCTGDGITLSAGGGSIEIIGNEIFGNGGPGIHVSANTNSCWRVIDGNTIYANGTAGIQDTTGTAGGTSVINGNVLANNILANNVGPGLLLDGAGMTAVFWNSATINYGNQTYLNTSGPCNLSGILSGDSGLDPQFVGPTDLRVGNNLRGKGYPADNNPGTTYRTYVTPGADQPSAKQPAVGDVRSGTSYADDTLVGTHTDPATSNVVLGIQWGAGGTEFTGTYSATTNPPTAPSLVVTDNGDGTGATATVTGSDGGTTEKVYYADPSATGLVTYAFIAQRVGDGTLALPVPAGRWIFQVLSYAASGVYSVGASYETTVSGLPAAGVVDNGDGTGLQVTTTDPDVTAIHTVEIQDVTIGTWRDGPNRTGPGTINVAAGEGIDNVVPGRTYWIRVRNLDSGNTTWTAQTLITPTGGYASDIYTLILAAKQKLIAHPIPRIGGRVYECLDPFSSLAAKPDLPAVFIWQPGSETVNPSTSDGGGGPNSRARTGLNVPIEIVIADVFDSNDSTNLQWWLAARQWVFDLFNRQPTHDSDNPKTPHGRRWQVVPGPITPADPSKYEYRTCTMILNTNIERTIGG